MSRKGKEGDWERPKALQAVQMSTLMVLHGNQNVVGTVPKLKWYGWLGEAKRF